MSANVTCLACKSFNIFFDSLNGFYLSYLVLKFGNVFPLVTEIGPKCYMILQGRDLGRSRSSVRLTIFCKTIRSLFINIHVKFH